MDITINRHYFNLPVQSSIASFNNAFDTVANKASKKSIFIESKHKIKRYRKVHKME